MNKNKIEARMMHGLITKEEAKFLIDHPSTNREKNGWTGTLVSGRGFLAIRSPKLIN